MSQSGLSIRAYARQRGISDTTVRKAIKKGRITLNADGSVNVESADAQWYQNTDPSQQREAAATRAVPREALNTVREATTEASLPGGGGATFMQARTANEVIKAQTAKVRLARLKGELVDRSQALAHVFQLARSERDAWLNWPARVSASLAAELQVDGHTFHTLLEREVRRHLEELGELRPKVD